MSIRTVCPSCRQVYNLNDAMEGKTVVCRECQSRIAVPTLARQGRREDGSRSSNERIATSSRPASTAGRASRDEDDKPRRRPTEPDDDDKPRRRPAERRSRRDNEDSPGGKSLMPILLAVGVPALLLVVGLAIGGVVLISRSRSGSGNQTVAANELPPAPVKGGVAPAPAPAAGPVKQEMAMPAGRLPAEMATDVVQKVKQSTAYLRVQRADGDVAQGSGFFALERGIVITNAHVVGMRQGGRPPRSVDIVIHSGEAGEAKLAGTLLGVDRENDLAVLRVQGDLSRLPPPLPVASAAALTETQNVYIFGFPFGAQLGKHITVSNSSISSLRRGNDGVLKQVQVNGGMNPGNSGGPVADARGVIVGVSVSGISGSQINFAVPGDFIQPLVDQSKSNPLDLTALAKNDPPARNAPPAGNDPPAGPAPGSGLGGDLAALKGTWQSVPVRSDSGGATGTIKLSISPQPGNRGGRIKVEIATKQGGRTTSSALTYSFTLEQKGSERVLITNIRKGARGTVKGMVFLYRFEGGQLILTGVVASTRLAYTLKNVALRRTAAEPEMPPAGNPANPNAPPPVAGGGGKGSPAALKFSGDVFAFVEAAVREKRLADVDVRGFTLSQATYRDVSAEGGVLIGFQVGLGKFVNNSIVSSLRPIFRTKNGEQFGQWHGPAPAAPVTVKAKPGYVVSALTVRAALAVDGFTMTFAKLGETGLDLADTYTSEPLGGNGGRPASVGGNGALFVGVTGHLNNGKSPCSLGLIAVLPKD